MTTNAKWIFSPKWLILAALALWPIIAIRYINLYVITIFGYQALLLTLLIYKFRKYSHNFISYHLLLIFSVTFALIADALYSHSVVTSTENALLLSIQEVSYFLFAAFMALFANSHFLKKSSSGTKLRVIVITAIHLIATYIIILKPFYVRPDIPSTFHMIVSTLYAISVSILFGILFGVSGRIIDVTNHVFTQSLLLMINADFALRFNFTNNAKSLFTWIEPAWSMAFGGILWCAIAKKNFPLHDPSALHDSKSLRSRMTQAFLYAVLVITAGLYFLNILRISDVTDLTILLLWIYIVWLLANNYSIYFSSKVSKISTSLNSTSANSTNNQMGIKEFDEILVAHNESVHRAVHLEQELAQLRKSEELMSLAKSVAHDIRTPLAVLTSLRPHLKNKLDENESGLFYSAIDRVENIAKNLLLHNSNKPILVESTTVCGLKNALESLVSEQKQLNPSVKIIATLPNEQSPLVKSQLPKDTAERILSNLINNSIEAGATHITVVVQVATKTMTITVSDNGKGIAAEHIEAVQQPGGTLGKQNGHGLGLSSSKKIIESFGGQLLLQSTPGTGTMITIELHTVFCEH